MDTNNIEKWNGNICDTNVQIAVCSFVVHEQIYQVLTWCMELFVVFLQELLYNDKILLLCLEYFSHHQNHQHLEPLIFIFPVLKIRIDEIITVSNRTCFPKIHVLCITNGKTTIALFNNFWIGKALSYFCLIVGRIRHYSMN